MRCAYASTRFRYLASEIQRVDWTRFGTTIALTHYVAHTLIVEPLSEANVARQAPPLWVIRDHHYQGVRSHMNTIAAPARLLHA